MYRTCLYSSVPPSHKTLLPVGIHKKKTARIPSPPSSTYRYVIFTAQSKSLYCLVGQAGTTKIYIPKGHLFHRGTTTLSCQLLNGKHPIKFVGKTPLTILPPKWNGEYQDFDSKSNTELVTSSCVVSGFWVNFFACFLCRKLHAKFVKDSIDSSSRCNSFLLFCVLNKKSTVIVCSIYNGSRVRWSFLVKKRNHPELEAKLETT